VSEFWSAALGALLGFSTGVATEWWKSGREDLRDLCKGFCEVVSEAAQAGADFWLAPAGGSNAELLLIRVKGYQTRLDGYVTILDGRLDDEALDEIGAALAALFHELTGGDPNDPTRQSSAHQALAVYIAASEVFVAIRRASYSRMSFKQRVMRYCTRSWVNQTHTMKLPPKRPFERT